jgi:DNA-binding XRE family transcriptional regulator
LLRDKRPPDRRPIALEPGGVEESHQPPHKWSEIKNKMSRERKARVDTAVRRELLTMELRELRKEAGKTQAEVAEIAEMTQAELSKLERRDDHLLPALRDRAGRGARGGRRLRQQEDRAQGSVSHPAPASGGRSMQQRLYFLPDPHGHGSFRPGAAGTCTGR